MLPEFRNDPCAEGTVQWKYTTLRVQGLDWVLIFQMSSCPNVVLRLCAQFPLKIPAFIFCAPISWAGPPLGLARHGAASLLKLTEKPSPKSLSNCQKCFYNRLTSFGTFATWCLNWANVAFRSQPELRQCSCIIDKKRGGCCNLLLFRGGMTRQFFS